MHLSSKSVTSLKLLIYLGVHYSVDKFIPLSDIASKQDLSKKYLEQIVPSLKAAKILAVKGGKEGGYCLARPPKEITLSEILGVSENLYEKDNVSIAIDEIMAGLDGAMDDYLSSISLKDLIEKEMESYSNSYVI